MSYDAWCWHKKTDGCLIVANYVGQLKEEKSAEEMSNNFKSMKEMPIVLPHPQATPIYNDSEYKPLAAHDYNEYPVKPSTHQ